MDEQEFHRQLVQRYTNNTITEEEMEVFFHLLKEGKLDMALADAMNKEENTAFETPIRQMPYWRRIAAAAAIIALVATGGYLWLRNSQDGNAGDNQQTIVINDIQPGGNKAILTLSDGSRIELDSAKEGLLAKQGNTEVIKSRQGELAYSTAGSSGEVTYNTVSTPPGGQYQVTLHDGSRVWLNASSSIKFPTVFAGNERHVQLTGEAYFEVMDNKQKPFTVEAKDLNVKVLGTQFNIMSYEDEPAIRATVIEGSVKAGFGPDLPLTLRPGEQASLNKGLELKLEKQVDTEQVMAWKNGLFHFRSADIQTIMRQVARWYDIEVSYEAPIEKRFSGTIPRNVTIKRILEVLELAGGVHFRVEGRKLTVTR